MTGRTVRTFLFLLAWVPLGGIGLGLLVAGWGAVSGLAITPLVVPALVAFRIAVGGAARLDAGLANGLLGTSVRPRATSPGPRGFWRAGLNVLVDGAFWRQQTYLLLRLTVGFAVAVGEVSLLVASLGSLALPIWYPWSGPTLGSWHVDTLPRALIGVPVGVVGLVLGIALARPIASGARYLVEALLGDAGRIEMGHQGDALRIHALAYGLLNLLMAIVWALTSRGYFWPEWTMIAFGLPLAVHASVVLVGKRARAARRPLGVHAGVSASLSVFFTLIWAVTSRGYFWPAWPMLALGVALVVRGVAVYTGRGSQERIAVLEETRAGAVDQRESDLARIERDLHDGAQARLVALGMSLGMAEQKLASDPAAAQELLAEARRGTREALEELRNLARGIHPPVLADRGLAAAIAALADRTPQQVNVAVDVPRRPPRAAETAAYFVVAEALANAGKHAAATRVDIAVSEEGDELVVEIVDDGAGGADPAGGGLRGLARRVEALDGHLEVASPQGGPTTIRAVIPCGS